MEAVRNTSHIFRRELKSYFESPVAYVFLVAFLLLTGFFTFMVSHYYEAGQADLRSFFLWHPWLYLVLVPAAGMRLWAEERRAGTLELLLTLPVTMTQAIVGKFLAAWLFLTLALALTFPLALTTSFWLEGNLDGGVVVGGYMGSILLAGTYLSVSMLTSAMTRNQVISFVLSLGICLFLVLAGWPPVTEMLEKFPNWFVKGIAAFSVMPHFDSIQRGVLDLRDIGYYISVVVVMLFATHLTLQNRKAG
jgi:ABC-2 type transport system permease protein